MVKDKLFLLSIEEYNKYKDVIPQLHTHWWLRSQGANKERAMYVASSGWVNDFGEHVGCDDAGIRPALVMDNLTELKMLEVGEVFTYHNFPFTVIKKGKLAIATVPVHFDIFDTENNNYRQSVVRQYLQNFEN